MPRIGKSITKYSKYCILKEEYMSTISQYYLGEKNTSHGCITGKLQDTGRERGEKEANYPMQNYPT